MDNSRNEVYFFSKEIGMYTSGYRRKHGVIVIVMNDATLLLTTEMINLQNKSIQRDKQNEPVSSDMPARFFESSKGHSYLVIKMMNDDENRDLDNFSMMLCIMITRDRRIVIPHIYLLTCGLF